MHDMLTSTFKNKRKLIYVNWPLILNAEVVEYIFKNPHQQYVYTKQLPLQWWPTCKGAGVDVQRDTLHVHTCSGRNSIIPLMRRPNTDSTPNKPVTLPRKPTFGTLRGHESRPHCHETVLRYAVTLQVRTHPKSTSTEQQTVVPSGWSLCVCALWLRQMRLHEQWTTFKSFMWNVGITGHAGAEVKKKKIQQWNLLQWTQLSADVLIKSKSWIRMAGKIQLLSFQSWAPEVTIEWLALLLRIRSSPRTKSQPWQRLSLRFLAASCSPSRQTSIYHLNPLSPELNPICYFLALLGAHHFLHVSRIRVKLLTLRWLMSYIYGAPILDVSRSHTTTQHSR